MRGRPTSRAFHPSARSSILTVSNCSRRPRRSCSGDQLAPDCVRPLQRSSSPMFFMKLEKIPTLHRAAWFGVHRSPPSSRTIGVVAYSQRWAPAERAVNPVASPRLYRRHPAVGDGPVSRHAPEMLRDVTSQLRSGKYIRPCQTGGPVHGKLHFLRHGGDHGDPSRLPGSVERIQALVATGTPRAGWPTFTATAWTT
jgi:hypothetical protein